jgi:hypothetical protein
MKIKEKIIFLESSNIKILEDYIFKNENCVYGNIEKEGLFILQILMDRSCCAKDISFVRAYCGL